MRKSSFVLHIDSLEILDDMPDEFAGKLFKVLKHFQTTGEIPEMDFALRMAAMPFIKQFERDAAKYIETVEANRINGMKGGRPPKADQSESNQNNPLGFWKSESNPSEAKKGDSDSDSDNDSESGNDSKSDLFRSAIADKDFSVFYDLYSKKVELKAARKAWDKLTTAKKKMAMSAVVAYVMSTPDVRFRKNPASWLNGECWNDEIGKPANNNQASAGMVKYRSNETAAYGEMPLDQWMRVHENNPNSLLTRVSNVG